MTGQNATTPAATPVLLRMCKACSAPGEPFMFADAPLLVMKGAPDLAGDHPPFTAVSHVWGSSPVEHVACRCGASIFVLASGASKLLAAVGSLRPSFHVPVWLDVMSIDQGDSHDIAAQVSIMGRIFSHADHVDVILNEPDFDRFLALHEAIDTLEDSAEDIKKLGARPTSLAARSTSDELIYKMLQIPWLVKSVMDSVYMSRAWTFQEWLLAKEVTLYSATRKPIHDFKAKLNLLPHLRKALISVSFEKAVPIKLFVKLSAASLLLAKYDDFLTDISLREQIHSLSDGNGDSKPDPAIFAVAFDRVASAFSTTPRQSTNACDQIASWVSMLSLSFPYDRHDSMAVTVEKVLAAMSQKTDATYPFLPVRHSLGIPYGLGIGKSYFELMAQRGKFSLVDAVFHYANLCKLRNAVYDCDIPQPAPSTDVAGVPKAVLLSSLTATQEVLGVYTTQPRHFRASSKSPKRLEDFELSRYAALMLRPTDARRAARCFNLAMACLSLSGQLPAFGNSPVRVGYRLNTIAQHLYEMHADFSLVLLESDGQTWITLASWGASDRAENETVELEVVSVDGGRRVLRRKSGEYVGWCLKVAARERVDAFVSFGVDGK
ncbi:hypothetical protein HK405_006994 [Cladochytrium tenue]|nr:hypothetical protein HK405_006994 [Cladochytrium tenue]